MKSLFKKYFIPHDENDYNPHLFRKNGILGLLAIIILIFVFASLTSVVMTRTNLVALVLPRVLADYANKDRAPLNLKTLAISTVLEKAAQLKANDMASKGYFAHNSPEGHTPWYWFEQAGYNFIYAGENLAVNYSDSIDINDAWMNSPSHKANIVNGNFTEIGIATAEGIYNGKKTIFVVELFGRPISFEALPLSLPKKSSTTTKLSVVKTSSKVTTIASSTVLGASGENDIYLAVASNVKYSNFIEKIISSPKKILSVSYLLLSVIILIGLILVAIIEIKKQNPLYILLSFSLILLMLALVYIFQAFLFTPLIIA